MASRRYIRVFGATAIILYTFTLAGTIGSRAQEPAGNYGVGIPDVFPPE